jgi:hypothetical protein
MVSEPSKSDLPFMKSWMKAGRKKSSSAMQKAAPKGGLIMGLR